MEYASGTVLPLAAVPRSSASAFVEKVVEQVEHGGRIVALFAAHDYGDQPLIYAVVANDGLRRLWIAAMVPGERYHSLTQFCPQAHWFEREIHETWGILPLGHPWLKPVRFHAPVRSDRLRPKPAVSAYYEVEGEDVHEVAVGPVHAGIIEPGHFRFQCCGEEVLHLEISLGYQHRGVERALCGGPDRRTVHLMETLAGDTSIGHAWAYCAVLESLVGYRPTARGQALRAVALELERLANHTGDLGALAGDIGYLPTASYCGRLRGDFLNQTALLCGNRFGRGLVRPGGVAFDVDETRAQDLIRRLMATLHDVRGAATLLFESPAVLSRFEDTGVVNATTARSIGLVGPAARASGLARDIRRFFPPPEVYGADFPLRIGERGDVLERARIRWLEIQDSAAFVVQNLSRLPEGSASSGPISGLPASSLAVSLVEGWRGEICHVAATDETGRFAWYKVVDPSFHNWFGLAMALRNVPISDFPLCNKSFNLSYCGHDL